jgi:hypothetical protein
MVLSKCILPSSINCEFCRQKFKLKGKCYYKHIAKCNKNAAKSILSSNSSDYCGRNFVINGACYKKHFDKCKLKHTSLKHLELYINMQATTSPELNSDYEAVDSMLDPIFEFSDNYFHDDYMQVLIYLVQVFLTIGLI